MTTLPIYYPLGYTCKFLVSNYQAGRSPFVSSSHLPLFVRTAVELRNFWGRERGITSHFLLWVLESHVSKLLFSISVTSASKSGIIKHQPPRHTRKGQRNAASERAQTNADERTSSSGLPHALPSKSRSVGQFLRIGSKALVAIALQPLSIANLWQIVSSPASLSLSQAFKKMAGTEGKSLFDGIGLKLVEIALRDQLSNILRPQISRLTGTPTSDDLQLSFEMILHPKEHTKRQFVSSFRSLMKSTLNEYLVEFSASLLLYPLTTLRLRMEAQGADPEELPLISSNSIDVLSHLIEHEGLPGFFRGYLAHLLSAVPTITTIGIYYAVISILIEYLMEEDDEEEEECNEGRLNEIVDRALPNFSGHFSEDEDEDDGHVEQSSQSAAPLESP